MCLWQLVSATLMWCWQTDNGFALGPSQARAVRLSPALFVTMGHYVSLCHFCSPPMISVLARYTWRTQPHACVAALLHLF